MTDNLEHKKWYWIKAKNVPDWTPARFERWREMGRTCEAFFFGPADMPSGSAAAPVVIGPRLTPPEGE